MITWRYNELSKPCYKYAKLLHEWEHLENPITMKSLHKDNKHLWEAMTKMPNEKQLFNPKKAAVRMKKLTLKESRKLTLVPNILIWCDFLHCFLRRFECGIALDIFCVYICEGKQQQNKYNLGTHYSKVTDAITNFHPTSCVPDLMITYHNSQYGAYFNVQSP